MPDKPIALPGVDPSRLAPPRGGTRSLARDALVARLLDARRQRCLLVQAPAGFGKTTLLAAWRQALLPLGFDVAWLSVASDHDELPHFLESLLAALATIDAALVREAADLLAGDIDRDGAELLAITLVRRIAEHPRDVVVVLDDAHHLKRPAILDLLQWLLDYAPPQLHLVLGTRYALRLSLERLRAQQQALALDLRDLRFTPAESAAFLKLQVGDVDARIVRLLHEQSDGWPAALQLFAADLKLRRGHPAGADTPFARVPMRDADAFSRYFERELLAMLTPAEVELLVCASACTRFCAALLAALVGRNEMAAEAARLLTRLQTDGLFITEIDGVNPGERWFRMHPLLQETLHVRLVAHSAAAQREMHARAWSWLRERGLIGDALFHAVRAGEAAAAADYVEQHAQALFALGERRALFDLIRQIPPAQMRARIGLRLWHARIQLYLREFDACAAALAQLAADVPPDDLHSRHAVAMMQATLAVQRDDTDSALSVLPQLLATPPGADAHVVGGRNNLLSWLYMHRGEFERARQVQLDAAPLLLPWGVPLLGTPAGSLQGRCLIGLTYALEGRMAEAERVYRAVLHEAAACGRAGTDPLGLASALLADVLYERSDIEAVRDLLEPRIDLLERVSIPDSVLRMFRALAGALALSGLLQEAFAWNERLEDYALRGTLDRLLSHALADRMHLHLVGAQLEHAEAALRQLDELDARHAGAAAISAGREIRATAQRARVRWLLAVHDYERALATLGPLLGQSEAQGHLRIATELRVQRAVADWHSGRADAAADGVVEALQRGHRLGLLRTLLDADPMARKLIGDTVRERTVDPVLGFYAERLLAAHAKPARADDARSTAPARRASLEGFNERELDVLRLLAQALPNKKIARALNLSPETVKWYLSRIYGKLQVSGRDEAVASVRDMDWGKGAPSAGR